MFSFSLTFKNTGLPIGKPFSFNEDYLMNITCPYCYSENVSRSTSASKSSNTYGSMAGAGVGTMISKSLPIPMSPLLGGLMGVVVGGLIDSLTQTSHPQQPTAYFHCNNCQCNFN